MTSETGDGINEHSYPTADPMNANARRPDRMRRRCLFFEVESALTSALGTPNQRER